MEQPILTVLMPCLNEAETLATCIEKAKTCMETLQIQGEVLIADNGSTDGSQEIAEQHGARVVRVQEKGYGSALLGGINAAKGKYIIMGDADDSYDFLSLKPFIDKLEEGYELVMGNRFKGGIAKGAMPPLHRYFGNPVLSTIGRLLYKSDIRDFHCGLRGFRKDSIQALHLITTGMEFASEMVVKATINNLRITEVPTTLSPDGRNRPPHLRSWHDGWRHLKFLLIYCPKWLFLYPGAFLTILGIIIICSLVAGPVHIGSVTFDIHTMLYGAMFTILGVQIIATALFTQTYAINSGMMPAKNNQSKFLSKFTLEKGLVIGSIMAILGLIGSILAVKSWGTHAFGPLIPTQTMRLTIPSVTLLILGLQFMFSSFFLHILNIKHK
jgi:putative glycosyltransferase